MFPWKAFESRQIGLAELGGSTERNFEYLKKPISISYQFLENQTDQESWEKIREKLPGSIAQKISRINEKIRQRFLPFLIVLLYNLIYYKYKNVLF